MEGGREGGGAVDGLQRRRGEVGSGGRWLSFLCRSLGVGDGRPMSRIKREWRELGRPRGAGTTASFCFVFFSVFRFRFLLCFYFFSLLLPNALNHYIVAPSSSMGASMCTQQTTPSLPTSSSVQSVPQSGHLTSPVVRIPRHAWPHHMHDLALPARAHPSPTAMPC